MAPKRSSSRALNTQTQKTTRSRRSASVTSTGTRRSARLAGEDASDVAPPEEPAAASSDAVVETATLAVITEGSDDDEAPSSDAVEVQQQLEDKDPSTATATDAAAASSDAPVETATLVVINEGPDDEASVPEAVEAQQQLEDKETSMATEAAPLDKYDESLVELAYPEDDPELEPTESQEIEAPSSLQLEPTQSHRIEASSSLPLQPTIYDYSVAPEESQSSAPPTTQLPDQFPPPQPRTISNTKAAALLDKIAKLGKKLLDEDEPEPDSSSSEAEPEPANAPEEVYSHRRFWPTNMGPAADDSKTPEWYPAAKGLAWGFYQQRKDIAHCAKLYPRAEMVLKNIEASCLREKLFQDRLMVYFREHMADKSGEEGETAAPPPPAPFLSSKDVYGVTVSEVQEEMERIAAKAGESSLKLKTSAGTKRSREDEDEEEKDEEEKDEEEKDVESEREPRRQKLTH